jgi:uncharacterized membrane protein
VERLEWALLKCCGCDEMRDAYGAVGVFVGFAMRWTSWTFGLSQVLYPELYEQVGFWLVRLGIVVASVGYLGYLITHYLF